MKMNEELHIFNFAPPSALRTLKTMWAEDQGKRKENEKCVWIDRAQGALRTLKTMWAEEQGKRKENEKCVWIDRAQGALRTLKTMWAEDQGIDQPASQENVDPSDST